MMIDMAERVIVENYDISIFMTSLLNSSPIAGRHTSIIHLRTTENGMEGKKHIWAQPTVTPWGQPLPSQCPSCFAFCTWGKKIAGDNGTIGYTCKAKRPNGDLCNKAMSFPKPDKVLQAKSDWITFDWP